MTTLAVSLTKQSTNCTALLRLFIRVLHDGK